MKEEGLSDLCLALQTLSNLFLFKTKSKTCFLKLAEEESGDSGSIFTSAVSEFLDLKKILFCIFEKTGDS
jgi:hypothetical protein